MSFIGNLRRSVRPVLTYLFAVPFVGLAVYSFIKYGTEQLAFVIISGFIATTSVVTGIHFQSRNYLMTRRTPRSTPTQPK